MTSSTVSLPSINCEVGTPLTLIRLEQQQQRKQRARGSALSPRNREHRAILSKKKERLTLMPESRNFKCQEFECSRSRFRQNYSRS